MRRSDCTTQCEVASLYTDHRKAISGRRRCIVGVILFTLFVGDFAKAVRNGSGLHFGLYHSLYEWFHPLYKEDKLNNFTTRKFVQVGFICCTQ